MPLNWYSSMKCLFSIIEGTEEKEVQLFFCFDWQNRLFHVCFSCVLKSAIVTNITLEQVLSKMNCNCMLWEKLWDFSPIYLTDTDEFSQQIFGSAQTPVWKSNFSLSNAAHVCVLKKQEPRKHGFKVIWLTQMNLMREQRKRKFSCSFVLIGRTTWKQQ